MKKKSAGQKIFLIVNYLILSIAGLLCLLPFINLLAVSFSSSSAVAAGSVTFWPREFTLSSYEYVMHSAKFIKAFLISLKRVGLGLVLNMFVMICTAYPLSKGKKQLYGKTFYTWYFVITMLIGGGMIPSYLVIVKLHLIDTIWALVLPGALPVSNMIILMNFFKSTPEELEEAAQIDGAGMWMTLWKVVLPISKPGLATVALFSIVGHWNSWFDGLIYMNNPNHYPLQSYLQTLVISPEKMLQVSGGDYTKLLAMINARTGRAAQLFLGALPILMVYPFLQKYFSGGLLLGSVKG